MLSEISENELKLFKIGKVKEVFEVGSSDMLEFKFTDHISVFDKVIPTNIQYKGETLCRTSAFWFNYAQNLGIKSHFISMPAPNRMRVKKVDIIKDYSQLTPTTRNYLIPLEFICRYYVAGSMYNRLQKGKVSPEILGFSKDQKIDYGAELPEPFIEVTTKLEPVDRSLTYEEAMDISGLTKDEYDSICDVILTLDEKVNSEIKGRGLIHVDGKKEFAFDAERNVMLIDTFGTADEDRFWDKNEYDSGNFIEFSKEHVRKHYKDIGYYDKLMSARDAGEPEPNIPPLDQEKAKEVSELYIDIYEKISGEKFRD
jgi:phosphoribosylaminoimidazole-succinocarboxamide synthase